MANKASIGPWLTEMIQSREKMISHRAVEYLKTASDECTRSKDSDESENASFLVDEVASLEDFVPALLSLGDRGIEEASTTYIVKNVLDRMISKPFAVTVVLCDAVFLAMMIVGFRYAVNSLILGEDVDVILRWIYVANTGIFYFIIREIGKFVSLFLFSKRARIYFLSFWNAIDISAVGLALMSTVLIRYHFTFNDEDLSDMDLLRGLLAVTTGMLWLRVLSLLKAINQQLATFVLAIIQITKDILWFCVITFTLVVSFSQMFFTLLAPSTCSASNTEDMQCKPSEYLLRSYSVLLGDFGLFKRESFSSGFSVFMIVVYTFLVTVVLLNVLIAVASDSYEKCLLRSQNLFGRARVMLVAELVSFQHLLKRSDESSSGKASRSGIYSNWWASGPFNQEWSRGSVLFLSLSILVIIGWTIAELVGYANGDREADYIYSLLSVIVNVVLFGSMMLFLASGANQRRRDGDGDSNDGGHGIIQRFMLHILGRDSKIPGPFRKKGMEDWHGRVNFLQEEMERLVSEQSRLATEHAKTLEAMVNSSELRLRAELNLIDDNFNSLKSTIVDEIKGSKKTNHSVTLAVEELKTLISMAASTDAYRSPVPSEVDVNQTRFVRYEGSE